MRKNDMKSGRDSKPRDYSRYSSFSRERFDSSPREMHKAICAECGKECEVPFKPTEGRSVYCRECYSKQRSQRF